VKDIARLSIILGFVCFVAAFSLSFVYQHTKPIIEQNREKELRESLSNVLPEAKIDYNPITEGELFDALKVNVALIALYKGNKDGKTVYAASVSVGGYQGAIRLLIGFDPNVPEVLGVRVLEQAETPGLGSRIEEEDFLNKLKGRPRPREKYDTITGATISSSAVIGGIVRTMNAVLKARRKG
jgi:electron transport complex protein RnfG